MSRHDSVLSSRNSKSSSSSEGRNKGKLFSISDSSSETLSTPEKEDDKCSVGSDDISNRPLKGSKIEKSIQRRQLSRTQSRKKESAQR